jgi:sterol 24-C-methyltransferase
VKANRNIESTGFADTCKVIKGDFMHIPEPDESFDSAYAIEATCHAPDKVGVYSEIYRILKPGSTFAGNSLILTVIG